MWIQLDSVPSLDTDDVYNWILHGAPNMPLKGPDPKQTGMSIADRRSFTSTTKDTNSTPLVLFALQRERYNLFSRNKFVGTFDVDILTEQEIRLTAISCLLTKPNLPHAAEITALFRQYDHARDGDPAVYAASHLQAGITPDMFSVAPTYLLEKNGAAILHIEEREAKLQMLSGHAVGSIGGNSWEYYQADKKFTYVKIAIIDIGRPVVPISNLHAIDVIDVVNPDSTIFQNLVLQESNGLRECEIVGTEKMEIFTLTYWPEFKFSWHDVEVDIGCGLHIVVTLPLIQTRVSSLVLWAYLGHSNQVFGTLLRQVLSALYDAALDAIVTGLVTGNYYAAAAAFEAVFEQKLLMYAGKDVLCLVPGIAVLHKDTPWVP